MERRGPRGGGHSCLPLTPPAVQMETEMPEDILEVQQPADNGEDVCPVHKTLHRGQPVAQEDGKESRMSQQERV